MSRWAVLAAFSFFFTAQQVVVEVGQVDRSLRVLSIYVPYGADTLDWQLRSADPGIALVRRLPDDRFEIEGVSPGVTGIARSTGGYYVKIKVVCGQELPVRVERDAVTAKPGDRVTLHALSDIATRTLFEWFEGAPGDTSKPLAPGPDLTFAATASKDLWVRATTACSTSTAAVHVTVLPGRGRAVRH